MPETFKTPKIRIGVVQFDPKIGQVQENIDKVRQICSRIEPRSVDILCLPEMFLTGYNFEGSTSISPFLETPYKGLTSKFCSEIAQQLQCHVAGGYPEKLETEELTSREHENGGTVDLVGANSAVLYGPSGQALGNYRKSNLFSTDQTWAKEGTGFITYNLPSPLNRISTAICMDLNPFPPRDWRLEDGPYEVAEHCVEKNVNLLVLLNAWLDSGAGEEDAEEPDWSTVSYWTARLRPLWTTSTAVEHNQGAESKDDRTIVVICNRIGIEEGKKFAGSSCCFDLHRSRGRPTLHDAPMGRAEEGLKIWTV